METCDAAELAREIAHYAEVVNERTCKFVLDNLLAAAYKSFMGSKSKKGWGQYAAGSVEEFYADGMAKSMLGKSDRWTKAIRKAK